MTDIVPFTIHRISPTEYHINGVKISKHRRPTGRGGYFDDEETWQVRPIGEDLSTRPMFQDESLEKVFDLVEGAMKMMAPRRDAEE